MIDYLQHFLISKTNHSVILTITNITNKVKLFRGVYSLIFITIISLKWHSSIFCNTTLHLLVLYFYKRIPCIWDSTKLDILAFFTQKCNWLNMETLHQNVLNTNCKFLRSMFVDTIFVYYSNADNNYP